MDARASALISRLGLHAHPEGGYYSEVYRSPLPVAPLDGRAERAALTTIYFLVVEGQASSWHRVASDEVWHYYEGDVLELYVADERFDDVRVYTIGPVGDGQAPVSIAPAGHWQAARTTGAYTLIGCTVAPGFDFDDFVLLAADFEALAAANRSRHASLVRRFLRPDP